eukprot:6896836-Heterocapsa_arctica.AAC.1
MGSDVQETRPAKRRREGQRDSDLEEEIDGLFSHTSEENSEVQNYPDETMEEARKVWAKHEIVPA